MNDDKIVVYQSYIDPINANIVKGLLDSYGIECFLTDENMVTLNAMYSSAVGGVKLHVFEKDIERISEILASENANTDDAPGTNREEGKMICPECHSSNVSYGASVNRKFRVRDILVSIVFMIYPFTSRKACHCFDCGHEFKKSINHIL